MTEATDDEYEALHRICDKAGRTVMVEAMQIGAPPAVSLRSWIILCACTLEDTLGSDLVADFLAALSDQVRFEGDPISAERLNFAGAALDAREREVRFAAQGLKQ